MPESINLQEVEQNVRRSVNEDGLLYLLMGLLLALVGLSFADSRLTILGTLGALLIFPLEWLRRRITYPRIGYVQFKAPEGTVRGIVGFMVIAIAALVVIAFAGGGRFQRYLPLAISVVFGLSFYFGASMSGIRLRDWVVIAVMVGSGGMLIFLLDDWHQAVAVQFGITAILLLVLGTVALRQFLRENPLPQQGDNDGDHESARN